VKVTAEAELLAAIVTFFERVGLTSKDVVIKVNSRKVKKTKFIYSENKGQHQI
jgi:histidyl-tRNA synthetase